MIQGFYERHLMTEFAEYMIKDALSKKKKANFKFMFNTIELARWRGPSQSFHCFLHGNFKKFIGH